jgi:hypothetical protein
MEERKWLKISTRRCKQLKEVRCSVVDYVIRRLQIVVELGEERKPLNPPELSVRPRRETLEEQQSFPTDIKGLKELKKPRSANEMAALVAYYLANVADKKDRKDKITTKDIETYFRKAVFQLPTKTRFTLANRRCRWW